MPRCQLFKTKLPIFGHRHRLFLEIRSSSDYSKRNFRHSGDKKSQRKCTVGVVIVFNSQITFKNKKWSTLMGFISDY